MYIQFDENYYKKIIHEYKYNKMDFESIDFDLGNMPRAELSQRWLCHGGADIFASAYEQNKSCVAITGFGMSGPPHMGTLSQIFNAIALQSKGIPVHIILGDLDAYNGKNISLSKVLELSEKYQNFILSLGFNTTTPSSLRPQSTRSDVLKTSYLLGKFMDDEMFEQSEEDLHDFYHKKGKVDSYMSYRRKLSLNLMTSDFIDLFLNQNVNNVLVMLGIDEHRYVQFSNQTLNNLIESKEFNVSKPHLSSMYTKIIKGFNDYPKMSKSFPDSSIDVNTSTDKIMHLFFEKEGHHQSPFENVIFQMMQTVSTLDSHQLEERFIACQEKALNWKKQKVEYISYLEHIFDLWRAA